MSEIYQKLKKKAKRLIHTRSPSRPHVDQSSLVDQSIHSTDHLIDQPPSSSLVPVVSSAMPARPSTPALAPGSVPLTTSASRTPTRIEESSSKVAIIAKDVFKTTLVLLNDALNGVPLPGKGAITATIDIIKIAEVRKHQRSLDVTLADRNN
jgi:hypothetical protein